MNMEKYCHINLFDLQLDGKKILTDFSLSFDGKNSICLLGESGSGKSLLLKTLFKNSRLIDTNGSCEFYFLEGKEFLDWKAEIDFEHLDSSWQKFLNNFLKGTSYVNCRYALVLKLLKKPDFLFCEDLTRILSLNELQFLLKFLQEKNIKCFYITNQIESTVLFSYLIVIKNNKVAIEGSTLSVLQEEKIMKLLGFSLPFYVNMSIQLGYYGIVDKICLTKEELEENIWQSK